MKVNKAKADEQGTTPEEMIGKTDFDYFPEDQAKKSFEEITALWRLGSLR